MPIVNRDDAVEVENRIGDIFASSSSERASEIRGLFVEVLDFDPATGHVSLSPSPGNVDLPSSAEHVAELDGVHVLYIALDTRDTDRVRKAEAAETAKLISNQLGDDLLVVLTNTSVSQIHLVYPSFESARPTLRRMVIERDLPRRTAVQQFSNIYWNHLDSGSIRSSLDKAFDVEAVTKRFFEEYKRVFDLAIDHVEGFGTSDGEQEDKKLFVQTLFNRLMFIYFLSRKGWLTFGGDNDYLNALWRDYRAADGEDKNFHVDRLKLLFFAGLNNPQSRDLRRNNPVLHAKIGAPPFLNGGLFEKTDLDNRSGVTVPDTVIEPILRDLFDRFNFTVMESTPFDIEVAVDPEMLGKVFEELVTGRHDTGSYYTPRPVVSFMCREALKGYLEGCDTGLEKEDIAKFVDERETSGVSLPSAPKVAEALEDVTVVDPACGSGAYLLGMMQELVDLRTALFNIGVDARSLYDLKLHIIQRNLYGVDIDEFAVNIAMLRMWLSLVIEYEGDTPEPLPNLDFKVVKGDSLLGPDPNPDNYGDLFRYRAHSVATQLADLKARHMEATTGKDALKEEIASVQDELREALADTPAPAEAVDWRVEFIEVFTGRGGFDLVIGNPPYVEARNSRLSEALKDAYGNQVLRDWGSRLPRGSDLLIYFFTRSTRLFHDAGQGCLITQNAWLSTNYGKTFQDFSVGRFSFERIIDTHSRFFTAVRGPNINAIIALFGRSEVPSLEYTIVDSKMCPLSTRSIAPKQSLKWGHLFSMPEFYQDMLTELNAKQASKGVIEFGQGINVPMARLNGPGAHIPLIFKDVKFVAESPDGKAVEGDLSVGRMGKIPALVMPRGIGERHYCTFNYARALSYSQVELYLPDNLWESDIHYCLWAYLNSSFVWLFRELTGRKNLGGGLLKAEATDMKGLPINFDFGFAREAKEVFESLRGRAPLPVSKEVLSEEHLKIDQLVGDHLGFAEMQDAIRETLVREVGTRGSRSTRRL